MAFGITLAVAALLTLLLLLLLVVVLRFCKWLVIETGSAESLKYVPPILRALRDVIRVRQGS